MITVSIIHLPIWEEISPYLLIDEYDRDGSARDPRIRIGFVDMPDALGRRAAFVQMPCVACERPVHPLRRREGDGWDRLYYAPTCALTQRLACSRSRAAELEYERFRGIKPVETRQLALFG